jgi:DNA-directed RNA polymerase subunit H (RpoH/RPB5)
MNEEEKLIQEQANKLPTELRKAIEAVSWKALIKEISLTNNISPEKLENVERETMLVIYGFDALENYIDNLLREAGVTEEVAIAIAEEANKKIFSEISRKAEELEKIKPGAPVITTQETKKTVIAELSQRVAAAKQSGASVKPPAPEVAPEILPMIKKGEVAHEVPHVETPVQTPSATPALKPVATPAPSLPKPANPANPRYPGGLDPYREPLA